MYQPFAHLTPRGKPYDLPPLPNTLKQGKTMKLKSINIVKVVITPTGYCLVTTEDYGDAFLIPLHQSSNRDGYAAKAKEQPIDGEFIYVTSAEEIAECEIEAEWIVATPESVYWDSASFLHFWNAGRLVGVDVMLQGVFAQQEELFAQITGQEEE